MLGQRRFITTLTLASCLIFGQLPAVESWAQITSSESASGRPASAEATAEQWADAFDLALRIMQHKLFYAAINEEFKGKLGQKAEAQSLALSQIVYMLAMSKDHWPQIESYLEEIPPDSDSAKNRQETKERFQTIFEGFLADKTKVAAITRHADSSQPLLLELQGKQAGFSSIRMFVNHPSLEDPNRPNGKVIPADDLKQLLLDFTRGASEEIWFNAYDIDLSEFADVLLDAKKRGVPVKGGVDKTNYDEKPELKEVYDRLIKAETKDFQAKLVDSVGLNHQKIVIRDPFGPNAAVLLLSGNFTQSCLGPEGDAVKLPPSKRPSFSVPNANHALLIEGKLPAIVARQELVKILDYGVRGQSGFPTGGSFLIKGPRDSVTGKSTWITMTFSPNGGQGDINRDVLASLFKRTTGRIEAAHFAFSSDEVHDALVEHAAREAKRLKAQGKPANNIFRSVSDTMFSMRDWSAFLSLSGMQLNPETGVYSELKTKPMRNVLNADEYANWRENIRVGPNVYGDRNIKIDGVSYHITAKVHHKAFILPDAGISVLGTSFNPSENAETNNEQIVLVKDSTIMKRARGMLAYLWNTSRGPIAKEAARRNLRPRPQAQGNDREERNADPKKKPIVRGLITPLRSPERPPQPPTDHIDGSSIIRTCPALF